MRHDQRAELACGRQRTADAVVEQRNDEKAGQQGRQENGRGDLVLDLAALFLGLGHDDPDGFVAAGGLKALSHDSERRAMAAEVVKEDGLLLMALLDIRDVQLQIADQLAAAFGVHRIMAQRQGVEYQGVGRFLAGGKTGHAVIPAQLCRQGLGIVGQQPVERGACAAPGQQISGAGGQHRAGHPQRDHGQHQLLEQAGLDPAQGIEVQAVAALAHSSSSA